MSGIIEAQVILGFSKMISKVLFKFINYLLIIFSYVRISPKWSIPGKPGWREEEEEFILSGPVLKEGKCLVFLFKCF